MSCNIQKQPQTLRQQQEHYSPDVEHIYSGQLAKLPDKKVELMMRYKIAQNDGHEQKKEFFSADKTLEICIEKKNC